MYRMYAFSGKIVEVKLRKLTSTGNKWEKFLAWDSMGNHGTSLNWLCTVKLRRFTASSNHRSDM